MHFSFKICEVVVDFNHRSCYHLIIQPTQPPSDLPKDMILFSDSSGPLLFLSLFQTAEAVCDLLIPKTDGRQEIRQEPIFKSVYLFGGLVNRFQEGLD